MTHTPKFFVPIVALLITSCTVSKQVPYMQDAGSYSPQHISGAYPIKIGGDDQLAISVSSRDTVLARPFNRPAGGQGYVVTPGGLIDFPLFGPLMVAGMSPSDLADSLRSRIIQEGYIKDPTVSVKLINFKIAIMGEVNKPGVYPVPNERVTLLEALSMAGDLSIFGRRDRVLIVREEDGHREMRYLNLNSTAIFGSPYYYLRQNDVVYVEPNKAKAAESEYNPRLPIILAAVSALTSLASLIILIAK